MRWEQRFQQGMAEIEKIEADHKIHGHALIERMEAKLKPLPSSRNEDGSTWKSEADWPIPIDPADLRELIAMARIVLGQGNAG